MRRRNKPEGSDTLPVMRRNHLSIVVVCGLALTGLWGGGCASTPEAKPAEERPATVLALTREEYGKAFDAAIEVAAEEDMPAELRDRNAGVIESRPKVSGSVIEPWDWAAGSGKAALDATLAYQRRRVRFEFVPAGFRPTIGSESDTLTGRRTPSSELGSPYEAVDLAAYDGPIELRVWVYIEQAFTPNLQRSTWTFTQTTFAYDPLANRPVGDGTTRDRSIWTPIDRDELMEQAMLDKLRARMAG